MKIRIFVILLGIITTMPLFADRGERGAWDEINKNSSSVPSWFIALFIIVGYHCCPEKIRQNSYYLLIIS